MVVHLFNNINIVNAYCIMYTAQCTLCAVHSVYSTLYSLQSTYYRVPVKCICILYSVHRQSITHRRYNLHTLIMRFTISCYLQCYLQLSSTYINIYIHLYPYIYLSLYFYLHLPIPLSLPRQYLHLSIYFPSCTSISTLPTPTLHLPRSTSLHISLTTSTYPSTSTCIYLSAQMYLYLST